MAVMFTTQQGRTLRSDELTADELDDLTSGDHHIRGYEVGSVDKMLFHVHSRWIVEWWDA